MRNLKPLKSKDIKSEKLIEGIKKLSYIYYPFPQAKARGMLSLFALVLFSLLSADYLGNLLYGLVILLIGFSSLGSFYLPSFYILDEKGIGRRWLGILVRKNWADFRRLEFASKSLRLSPFSHRSFLDSFRGMELPLCGNRGLIEMFIKQHIAKNGN